MTAAERQDLIVATLRKERRVTISSLVGALGCSERTIRYDLDALSASMSSFSSCEHCVVLSNHINTTDELPSVRPFTSSSK